MITDQKRNELDCVKNLYNGKLVFLIVLAVLLGGCTSQSRTPPIDLNYGKIEKKEQFSGKLEETTLLGGINGIRAVPVNTRAAEETKKQNIESVSSRFTTKYRYTIKKIDGSTIRLVTEKDFFVVRDCVAIEKGYSYNLRLVSDDVCRNASKDEKIARRYQDMAKQCSRAKRQLIIAQSEREIATSNELVEASCQFSR